MLEENVGLETDWELDGLMEAEARGMKASNSDGCSMDRMLEQLGLSICADTLVSLI